MRRSSIKPGRKSLERGSTFKPPTVRKPPRRPAARISELERTLRQAWRFRALTGPCAVCGSRIGVTGHHVVPLRHLKAAGITDPTVLFDASNQLRLCMDPSPGRCHERHELHVQRVPRELVLAHAPRSLAFAVEHGLAFLFDREYPDISIERSAA